MMMRISPIQGKFGVIQGTFGVIQMMMGISLFGQLGLQASFQGCEISKRTTVDARLRGLSGDWRDEQHGHANGVKNRTLP
jgi:hypothetical protein